MQFELRGGAEVQAKGRPFVFRVDFDPQDPTALLLAVSPPLAGSAMVVGGPGMDPYMSVTDSLNMPIPAFGPIQVGN